VTGVTVGAHAPQRARAAAEEEAMSRLVNIYLRESGTGGPRGAPQTSAERAVPAPLTPLARQAARDGRLLAWLALPRSGTVLAGVLAARSTIGHHRFAPPLWLVDARAGAGERPRTVERADVLAELLAGELLAAPTGGRDDRAAAIAELVTGVGDSVARSARYIDRHQAGAPARDTPGLLDAPDPSLAAEQGLAFGHPFHPTPKVTGGFDDDDVERYAPEMGATFPLWWFAAPPALVAREQVPGLDAVAAPADVVRQARERLGPGRDGWVLVPCHPWQARMLAAGDELAAALDDGAVRLLGPLGADVHPTSSVRTVRLADASYWKLSLDVRITNFVRHNTPEEVRRALDASRVVATLPRGRRGRFEVLAETGYRALALPGTGDAARARLATATAALRRPAPGPGVPPLVVAALVEPEPASGDTPIGRLVWTAARARGEPPARVAGPWLRAYLRISLRPLLRLLVDDGVGFEAHTQNSLAGFDGGWPRRFVVRDLEGTSIDRSHPVAGAHRRVVGDASPVLYEPEDAWRRFAYYVVVNHIGQVVATVAAETGGPEEALWAEVGSLVRVEATTAEGPAGDHLRAALLGPSLPAKANLLSRLLGRSERPEYVDVPNPLVQAGAAAAPRER